MPLQGTFSTMPFADLLQWLGDTRRSGTLAVTLELEERYIRIEDGRIVAYGSDDPMARDLGRLCLSRGLVDEPTLLLAVEAQVKSQMPLGDVLVAHRSVDADALEQAVRAHVEETVVGLFLWPEGRFTLMDRLGPEELEWMPPEYHLADPIDVREILMEGVRRLDEWNRIVKVLPSDEAQLHALGPAENLPILEDIAAHLQPPMLGELLAERGDSRYAVCEQLVRAFERGLLAVEMGKPRAPLATARGSTTVSHLVRAAETLLAEAQHEEAGTLLKSALAIDPYRADARVLLRRLHEAQIAELYQAMPRDRVPVVVKGHDPAALPLRDRKLIVHINGRWDVAALAITTQLGELETLRALRRLIHAEVVKLQ